jgi:hypothetical protein
MAGASAAVSPSPVSEIGDLRCGDQRVELLTVRYVDSTELFGGTSHGACPLCDRSAGEAPAEPYPSPSCKALEVSVAGEHEGDAIPVREEEHLRRDLAARLARQVGSGVDRTETRVAHRQQRIGQTGVAELGRRW